MQVGLEKFYLQNFPFTHFDAEGIRVLSSLTDDTQVQKVGLRGVGWPSCNH